MDVFTLRDRLIADYRQYVEGFVTARQDDAREFIDHYFTGGSLWPEPLVQLNPSFAPGRSVDDFVRSGVLHPSCRDIFRRRTPGDALGQPLRLHQHQDDAIGAAKTDKSYVLTTGTGSGKSLAYFVPIVDHILRAGPGKGIKAIVVYPMNALCNSQTDALEQFLYGGYPAGSAPVRCARYTGQEKEAQRHAILAHPPDILLTNYVMLELILTRSDEQPLVNATTGLEFLVLDELHTYRGRQGADVAMLVRRVRERCGSPTMRCVGTSATLAGGGTREQRQAEVALVATRLFGSEVPPTNVIGETLRRATQGTGPDVAALRDALQHDPPYDALGTALAQHPLAVWAEDAFGLRQDEQGRLERRSPRTLSSVAAELAGLTGATLDRCVRHLRVLLLAGSQVPAEGTGTPLFAFRLHQFISRGGTVYSTPEPVDQRHLSAEGQQFVPGDRSRRYFPMAFCRSCGQDYLVVSLAAGSQLEPRELGERADADDTAHGFVVLDGEGIQDPVQDLTLLPEEWTETRRGNLVLRSSYRKRAPRRISVAPDGRVLGDGQAGGVSAWFIAVPFQFCFHCGITYASGRESDFSKLAELSSEGRSTATTVLSSALVRALRGDTTLDAQARKLLSFTDNRQDASLQAGHFNDFVQVTLLRSAILAAVQKAGDEGLTHDIIAQRVADALALSPTEYAVNPQALFAAKKQAENALREVIGYRVYHDLRRGWRITAPNLEQVGLLRVTYDALDELSAAQEIWAPLHPILAAASPADRERACGAILDYMRRSLAIKASYLDSQHQDSIKQQSFQYLREPWALDETERLRPGSAVLTDPDRRKNAEDVTLTGRSLPGRFLRRRETWPASLGPGQRVELDDFEPLMKGIVQALITGGHITEVPGVSGAYQLQAAVVRWRPGDGTVHHDPIRVPHEPKADTAVHAFFQQLYQTAAEGLRGLEAREHTAQVPADVRQEREDRFSSGALPVLYCSPTMELGVDIRDLNAVNMRNVPPTPANYAQRSGRAGRGGQPALVITYCTSSSPHDQYYFRRPEQMVSGAVAPPRIDLANEDLLRAHIHAVWLAETGQSLGRSVSDLLDLGSDTELPVREDVTHYIQKPLYQSAALQRCQRIFATLGAELTPERASWYTPTWLTETVKQAPLSLDRAADRWRHLYRNAKEQQERQHTIVADALRSSDERKVAQRLREEAEVQLDLLTRARPDSFSDFYSYRYFATEGFLPGYNFPRLPVTAYIPARGHRASDDFLSRGRFIAISEFGPRSILYHEGNRYRVSRVVLPREEMRKVNGEETSGSRTRTAQFCGHCGYLHADERLAADLCDRCATAMNGANAHLFKNLLRLESVSTYRVDRISCDEEERLRLGYEVQTLFRFSERDNGAPVTREMALLCGEERVASVTYGPATQLWRVNLGWNRRKNRDSYGFNLDMERGVWSKSDQEVETAENDADPLAEPAKVQRVVPYVEDHRNALLLELVSPLERPALLSLMYALKRGIELRYQLEGAELACEPLPTDDEPRQILFYEAAEGGAGVLVRLAEEPGALADVARAALELCHYDPDTGVDRRRATGATEECEAACYACLLSYGNQRYHRQLDRTLIRDILQALAGASGSVGAGGQEHEHQLDALLSLCGSDLERDFLRWLDTRGLRLPDTAQQLVEAAHTRPDFTYGDGLTCCVYVDGEPHTFPARQQRDAAQEAALENLGWTVIRVQGAGTWPAAVEQYPWVFGVKETAGAVGLSEGTP